MTYNQETFCKEANIYKNIRDWTKKQKDKANKRAKKRANDSQVRATNTNKV